MNLNKYKNSFVTLEIHSLIPEKFINLLWKNNIYVKNIKKKNITTVVLEVNFKDYFKIDDISKKTGTKVKIIKRNGIAFFFLKIRKRRALIFGILIFALIIYYLSTFIWKIDIETEKNLSPYEIRRKLISYGIKEGVNKKNLDVYSLEEKLLDDNNNIMWIRARIEGATLKITASERRIPPETVAEDETCDLVARCDGEVVRVYTVSGTAIVKNGDIVKKGDILVKGEQGKEHNLYPVHAKGNVIARTFHEEIKDVKKYKIKRERTGKIIKNIYIKLGNKVLTIKKSVNNFSKYDKIENNKGPIIIEEFYEVKEKKYDADKKELIDNTSKEIINKISLNFNKSVNIVDKIIDYKEENDTITVRVLVVAEENIAEAKK
ncbi:sporulation protein YqfD [Clostridium rectalis]|uniref:sporulation protein YqfD n=1 Tax=Clostridium rectalis TaxID=2040295 RepID=UPI0019D2B924|nr:sporulation protein YqfD [Clostridium rectalis]